MSWACLQHYATVVTSNAVTVCCSQFPPTVSKHCPHQHSATHKTKHQYATPTIPAVVIFKVPIPQSNIMTAFVRSNSDLLYAVRTVLSTNIMAHILQSYSVWSFPAHLLRHLHIVSKCHNKTTFSAYGSHIRQTSNIGIKASI